MSSSTVSYTHTRTKQPRERQGENENPIHAQYGGIDGKNFIQNACFSIEHFALILTRLHSLGRCRFASLARALFLSQTPLESEAFCVVQINKTNTLAYIHFHKCQLKNNVLLFCRRTWNSHTKTQQTKRRRCQSQFFLRQFFNFITGQLEFYCFVLLQTKPRIR